MISLFGKNEDPPPSLLDRLKQSVSKTRSEIASRVEGLFSGGQQPRRRTASAPGKRPAGRRPGRAHHARIARRRAPDRRIASRCSDPADLRDALKNHLLAILNAVPAHTNGAAGDARPRVIFVVGVNGTGKTTTIGKLAHRLHQEGCQRSAGRRRHLSRRGHRAARRLGRAHRLRTHPAEARRRSRRRGLRRGLPPRERATSTW